MITILLFGIRRSGNHFLISILLQLYSKCVHLNNVKLSYTDYKKYKEIPITANSIDIKYTGFKNADCVILSMENKYINHDELQKFQNIENLHTILLLRNPYNNLSSIWKIYDKKPGKIKEARELWINYANLFLNNNVKMIKVLYDELCENEEYRDDIIRQINPNFESYTTEKQIRYSNSSYQGKDDKRKVYGFLEDCVFKNDKRFCGFFTNTQINELWKKIIDKINKK
jgi:hypothetical protein